MPGSNAFAWKPAPAALPPDPALAAELSAAAGEGFRTHDTDHFTIAYNTPFDSLAPLTGRLEGTYDAVWRFCEINDLAADPPGVRLQVILFDRFEDYSRYGREVGASVEGVAGFYHHVTNRAVFCNTVSWPDMRQVNARMAELQSRIQRLNGNRSASAETRKRRDELVRRFSSLRTQRSALVKRFNRFVIQHEAAHQMFFNIGIHVIGADNPAWLVEGLACQFEVTQTGTIGPMKRINQTRLADVRQALSIAPRVEQFDEHAYQQALADGRLVPTADLITDPSLSSRDQEKTVYRYAQAWGLVFYLYRERRESFTAYLKHLQRRRPGETSSPERELADFSMFFGEPDMMFDQACLTYLLKLRFDPP